MAELAELWHWQPADMWPMLACELSDWRNRAVNRHNAKQEARAGKR